MLWLKLALRYRTASVGLLVGILISLLDYFVDGIIRRDVTFSGLPDIAEHVLFPLIGLTIGYLVDRRSAGLGDLHLRERQLAALHVIHRAAAQSLDLKEVLRAALNETLSVMEVNGGSIQLLEPGSETIRLTVSRGLSKDFKERISTARLGEGLAGQAMIEGRAIAMSIDEYAETYPDERFGGFVKREGIKSLASVPLIAKGEALGTLNLDSSKAHAWSAEELDFLTSVGRQLGVAVENALLYENTHERAARLALIAEIGQQTTAILELEELLHKTVGLICDTFGYFSTSIWTVEGKEVVLAAASLPDFRAQEGQFRLCIGKEGITGWVAAKGNPALVPDVRQDDRYYASGDDQDVISELAVPIKLREEVIGVLDVQSVRHAAFLQIDVFTLQTIADQLAAAIENSRLYEATRERAARLELVGRITQNAIAVLDPDDLVDRAVVLIHDAFGYYSTQVLLVEGDDIVLTASSLPALQPYKGQFRLRIGEKGVTSWVAEHGEPLLIPDVSKDDRYIHLDETANVKTELTVPIKVRDKIIGVLDVQNTKSDTFSPIDTFTLQTIADQLAVAIENSRLYETTRERAIRLELIEQVGRRTTALLELDELLHQAVDLISTAFGYYKTQVLLIDDDQAVLKATSISSLQYLEGNLKFQIGKEGIIGWVAETGEPVLVSDVGKDPRYVRRLEHLVEEKHVKAELAVPIILKNEIIGVLDVQSTVLAAFSQIDIFTLQAVATHMAVAIENSRLYETTRERATRLELIAQVGQQTTAILEQDELLHRAVDLISEAFGYYNTEIWVIDGSTLTFTATSLPDIRYLEGHIRLRVDAEGSTSWVARSGQPLLIPDVQKDNLYHAVGPDLRIRSELAVPIKLRDEIIGVLNAESIEPDAFSQIDIFTLQTIADQLAIAMENSRLYAAMGTYTNELEDQVLKRTAELRREKEQAETILLSAADAVIIVDAEGYVLSVNPAFETQTGYAADEIVGSQTQQLSESIFSHQSFREMLNATDKGLFWRGEIVIRRKDHTQYDADLHVAPLHHDEGEERGYVAVMRDISAQKDVEREKDAFVSDVSHELRTPIASLKLYHGLITLNPEKRDDYMETMQREIARLDHIIESLLRLSRLDQDQETLDIKLLDLNKLAGEYVIDRQLLANSKGLGLTFTQEAGLPPTLADESLLGQALSILLTNALNYTPSEGSVTINTASRKWDGRLWVGIGVSDTGPGIPPDEQPHLFERFFRGRAGRESGVKGTGLGLAIVKGIMDLHGGHIQVESEGVPGKGVTFNVWLPAKE